MTKDTERATKWRRNNRERANANVRRWAKNNPIARRMIKWRTLLGGKEPTRQPPLHCEICGEPATKTLNMDHCHERKVFRGWLCGNCNRALGLFKDNPVVLRLAATYLETWDLL